MILWCTFCFTDDTRENLPGMSDLDFKKYSEPAFIMPQEKFISEFSFAYEVGLYVSAFRRYVKPLFHQ